MTHTSQQYWDCMMMACRGQAVSSRHGLHRSVVITSIHPDIFVRCNLVVASIAKIAPHTTNVSRLLVLNRSERAARG